MADTLNDYMYAFYQRLVSGNAALSGAINVSRAAVGVEATSSVTGFGSANAPAADAVVGQIAALGSGTWEIEVNTFILGTTVGTLESGNMELRLGGVALGRIINPVNGVTGAVGNGVYHYRLNQAGTAALSVNAVAAATGSSIYKATIVANKIGF